MRHLIFLEIPGNQKNLETHENIENVAINVCIIHTISFIRLFEIQFICRL